MPRFLRPRPGDREQPDRPRLRDRLRSVYEERARPAAEPKVRWIVKQGEGRIVGLEIDGRFEELPPCCEDPLTCERPECWRPFPGAGP